MCHARFAKRMDPRLLREESLLLPLLRRQEGCLPLPRYLALQIVLQKKMMCTSSSRRYSLSRREVVRLLHLQIEYSLFPYESSSRQNKKLDLPEEEGPQIIRCPQGLTTEFQEISPIGD